MANDGTKQAEILSEPVSESEEDYCGHSSPAAMAK